MQAYTVFLGQMLRVLHRTELLAALEDRELRVLLAVLKYVNLETRTAFPAIETLAKAAGVAQATVYRALGSLHERGVLSWEKGVKLALGPLLLTAASLEHDVVLEAKASREQDMVLCEPLQVAARRKGSTPGYFAKLVERYGEDAVVAAVATMTRQYPDDSGVKVSFAKLVALALEGKWRHHQEVNAEVTARVAANRGEPAAVAPAPVPAPAPSPAPEPPATLEAAKRYVALFAKSRIPEIQTQVASLRARWGLDSQQGLQDQRQNQRQGHRSQSNAQGYSQRPQAAQAQGVDR